MQAYECMGYWPAWGAATLKWCHTVPRPQARDPGDGDVKVRWRSWCWRSRWGESKYIPPLIARHKVACTSHACHPYVVMWGRTFHIHVGQYLYCSHHPCHKITSTRVDLWLTQRNAIEYARVCMSVSRCISLVVVGACFMFVLVVSLVQYRYSTSFSCEIIGPVCAYISVRSHVLGRLQFRVTIYTNTNMEADKGHNKGSITYCR